MRAIAVISSFSGLVFHTRLLFVAGQCYDLPGNLRPSYTNANISVSNLWWYLSCDTHGCDGGCEQIVPSDNGWSSCHMGWPSYMVRGNFEALARAVARR
jgi:hypothetical protein